MVDREKVIRGLECLSNPYVQDMDERDCENCQYDNACCFLDVTADALSLLKAQEQRHRLEVHNIGNVDIPEGVTEEQFHAVMNNVVEALEHTDRGESWPYEPPKEETK